MIFILIKYQYNDLIQIEIEKNIYDFVLTYLILSPSPD